MTQRRFIAGATCPECKALDKMVVYLKSDLRECVACGFSESRPGGGIVEPQTRVSRPAARLIDTTADAVKLIMPDASVSKE